jgi:hypothetical protein
MFKKTLIAAAALSMLALGATAANAHGYQGHHFGYNFVFSNYDSDCYYESRPVTIKIWDDYSYSYYFKTVYRNVRVCD